MPFFRYLLFFLFLFPTLLAAQHECGTMVTPAAKRFMGAAREAAQSYTAPIGARMPIREIPIQAHIFNDDQGSGGLTLAEYEAGVNTLNEQYAEAGLTFVDCAPPIFYSDNELFEFNADTDVPRVSGAYNVPNVINIYVAETVLSGTGGRLCGFTYFPGSFYDLIVMNQRCFTNGSTLSHEIGHYFGLYHTHGKSNCGSLTDELVDGSNCRTAGDDVCDTPADPNLLGPDCDAYQVDGDCMYTGTALDANEELFQPDAENIMSYAPRRCRTRFTPGQFDRVLYFREFGRQNLECAPIVRPDNDLCTAAPEISCGDVLTGSTVYATGLSAPVVCPDFDMSASRGVWYRITGRGGEVTLDLCASDYDTQIAVFSGSCDGLECVVSNDDACAQGSVVNFLAAAGKVYYIYVHGYLFASGTYEMQVSCEPVACPPAGSPELVDRGINFLEINWDSSTADVAELRYRPSGTDAFITLAPATAPVTLPVDPCTGYDVQLRTDCDGLPGEWGTLATFESDCDPDYCYSYGSAAQVWITRVAIGSLDQRSASNRGYEYYPSPTTLEREQDYELTLQANDGAADRTVYWHVYLDADLDGQFEAGTNELLLQTSAEGNGSVTAAVRIAPGRRDGTTRLRVICSTEPLTNACGSADARETEDYAIELTGGKDPENERCTNARPLTCGETVRGETSPDGFTAPAPACTPSLSGNGQWFTVRGTGNELMVSMCGSEYETALGIYTGDCGELECVAIAEKSGCGSQSEISFFSLLGQTYYVFASGHEAATGAFTLSLECKDPDPELVNTVCTGALPLTCGDIATGEITRAGPIAPPAACGMTFTGPGRWFTLTGTGDKMVLDLCDSDYDTALGVFSGGCDSLVCVGGNNDGACDTRSTYSFNSVPGETYYVFVGGNQGAIGKFGLSLECTYICPEPVYSSGRLQEPYYRMDEAGNATFRFNSPGGQNPQYTWLLDGNELVSGDSTTIDDAGNLTHTFGREGMYRICFTQADTNGCPAYHCEDYLITFEDRSSPDIAVTLAGDLSSMKGVLLTAAARNTYWYSTESGDVRPSSTGAEVSIPFADPDNPDCHEKTLYASYQTGEGYWETKKTRVYLCAPDGCNADISSVEGGSDTMICTANVPLENTSWVVDGVAQEDNVDGTGTLTILVAAGDSANVCMTGYTAGLDWYRSCCRTVERTSSTRTAGAASEYWSIYPNPARKSFSLRGATGIDRNVQVDLFDVGGSVVRRWLQPTGSAFGLDGLAAGFYVVRLSAGEMTQVARLVISR